MSIEYESFRCRVWSAPRQSMRRLLIDSLLGPRRSLVATERGLRIIDEPRQDGSPALAWEAEWASVEQYWSVYLPGGEGPSERSISLVSGGSTRRCVVGGRDGKRLLRLIEARAPEAVRVRGVRRYWGPDVLRFAWTIAFLAMFLARPLMHALM